MIYRAAAARRPRAGLGLHLESPEGHHALWRETEVTHHRDLRVEQRANDALSHSPTFELHAVGTTSDEFRRIANALAKVNVVTQPRHVGHDVRVGFRRGDGAYVVRHLIDREVQRVS